MRCSNILGAGLPSPQGPRTSCKCFFDPGQVVLLSLFGVSRLLVGSPNSLLLVGVRIFVFSLIFRFLLLLRAWWAAAIYDEQEGAEQRLFYDLPLFVPQASEHGQ